MSKLTVEEVIGIADEVIPMWRTKKRDNYSCYIKYLVYSKCYEVRDTTLTVLCDKLGCFHSALLHYVRRYNPQPIIAIRDLWDNAIRDAEMNSIGVYCNGGSYGELLAKPLMDELNAKECRIDYVDGKIRVRYVGQAED